MRLHRLAGDNLVKMQLKEAHDTASAFEKNSALHTVMAADVEGIDKQINTVQVHYIYLT